MKNNRIQNEHDITKKMLSAIRNGINRLNENEESFINDKDIDADKGIETEIDDIEDENNELDTPEAKEEASKIGEMVNPMITVTSFKIYEDSGNVVMSGNFQNTDISWQFSKNDGLFINAENVNLTDNVKEMLDKLSAYYKNWQKELFHI